MAANPDNSSAVATLDYSNLALLKLPGGVSFYPGGYAGITGGGGSVNGANIVAGTVPASAITPGSLTAAQLGLAAGSLSGAALAAGSVPGSALAAGSISGASLAAGTVPGSAIAAGSFVDTTSAANTKTGPLTVAALNATSFASPNASGILRIFNVIDFGAVGDGVTNDYAAINAAITAATAVGRPYILFFPCAYGGYFIGANTLTFSGTPACMIKGYNHTIISGTASPVLSLTYKDSIESICVNCATNSGVVIKDSVNVGGSVPASYGISPIYKDLWITTTATANASNLLTCLGGGYWTFINLKCVVQQNTNRAATGISIQSGTSHTFINPQVYNLGTAFAIGNNPSYGYGFSQGIFISSPNVLGVNVGIASTNCNLLTVVGGSLDQCNTAVLQSVGDAGVSFSGVYCGFAPPSAIAALVINPLTSGHVGPALNGLQYSFVNCFFVNYNSAAVFLSVGGQSGFPVGYITFAHNQISGAYSTFVSSSYMNNFRFERDNVLTAAPSSTYWSNSADGGSNSFWNTGFSTYNVDGTCPGPLLGLESQHAVQGAVFGNGGTLTITFSGRAVFTQNTGYCPLVFNCSTGAFVTAGFVCTQTQFSFPTVNGNLYIYYCIGY